MEDSDFGSIELESQNRSEGLIGLLQVDCKIRVTASHLDYSTIKFHDILLAVTGGATSSFNPSNNAHTRITTVPTKLLRASNMRVRASKLS